MFGIRPCHIIWKWNKKKIYINGSNKDQTEHPDLQHITPEIH